MAEGGRRTLDAGPAAPARRAASPRRRLLRLASWAFVALVLVLVVRHARDIDWPAVGGALRQLGWATVLPAALLAAASHALYGGYELIGRHLTGHALGVPRTVAIGLVSYAFNLNLGSLVGGFALRLRLYTRAGLAPPQVAQVIATSLATNWIGYLALGGALFVWQPLELPDTWRIGDTALRIAGVAMLGAALAYAAVCARWPRREWTLRGHALTTPSARVALLQIVSSVLNWATIATTLWLLLGQRIDWPSVATTLLLAAVAGVVTHVPAGLGVLEAVFLALLAGRVPAPQLLAALIAYRAVYYLLPLAVAGPLLLRLERRRA